MPRPTQTPVESTPSPTWSAATTPLPPVELRLRAADGYDLGARIYLPAGRVRASAVIHGATAVPQTYYARFAAHLSQAGVRVVTYDYRGIGASRPRSLRGFRASMLDWASDASAATALAQEGGAPLLWIGHSFGGQLAGLVEEARGAAAAVFIGAQFGHVGDWPARLQPRVRLFWHLLVPALTAALGYYPGRAGLGEDLPAGVALQWRRWALQPGYYLDECPEARARLLAFDRPALFYSFTDDDFAPERAVRRLLRLLPPGAVLHRRLSPQDLGVAEIGHFGAFRPRFAATLWREVLAFVDHVLEGAPLPARLVLPREPGLSAEEIERYLYLRDSRPLPGLR